MIKLGVPSKGRLMKETFEWFAARGVQLSKSGSDREYVGRVDGVDGVELVLLSGTDLSMLIPVICLKTHNSQNYQP